MSERNVQGVLTFSGFMISVVTLFYFATEYIPPLSDWGRVAALLLLSVSMAAFGYYIQHTTVGGPFFDVDMMRWLKPSNMFYLLAIVALVIADGVFVFGVDDLPRPAKILVSMLFGVGLVLYTARTMRDTPPAE